MTIRLPERWTHNGFQNGSFDIEEDQTTTWDEDIALAEWDGWAIWIDGGKGMSVWQCTLVEPHDSNHRPWYLMRDFVNTPEEVQAWVDRAVLIAEKAHASRRPKQ